MLPTILSLDIYTVELSCSELKHVLLKVGKLCTNYLKLGDRIQEASMLFMCVPGDGICHHLAFDKMRLLPSKGN